MKIGITGATGHLGRIVIRMLKGKIPFGNIVALVRSPDKAKDLGLEPRLFDYEKPELLVKGLNGIDTLLLISASDLKDRDKKHINVINAAREAGVKWIVYTSLLHADTSTLGLASSHVNTEKAMKESGIPFTILRNGWYTENYMGSVPAAIKSKILYGCAGDGRVSSAAREDYAAAAVSVLLGEGHQGKVYELAGDKSYTMSGLAAEIAHQALKEVHYKNLTEKEYTDKLISFGVPKEMAEAIANWDAGTSKGDLFDESHQLSKLIKRSTTPLAETINETLKS
ncbi:MAG: SDR family oxidoreductase [Chitinophagaceae bacterium]|nr:SDR family oxidoreductase [Chitinophagaceae bacterium]